MKKNFASLLLLLVLTGCKQTVNTFNPIEYKLFTFNESDYLSVDVNNQDYAIMPIDRGLNSNINFQTTLSKPRQVYAILTNPSTNALSSAISVDTSTLTATQRSIEQNPPQKNVLTPIRKERTDILHFNHHPTLNSLQSAFLTQNALIAPTQRASTVALGGSEVLSLDTTGTQTVTATNKKVITVDGITLNILVDDNVFGTGCSKAFCVTQTMVDALGAKFLDASKSDIYHWVTNIVGTPWGSHNHTNLISSSATNEIDILLVDLDNDNSTDGGTLGYFWSKDNYLASSYPGSNERLMFYMDAVLLANPSNNGLDNNTSWTITDYWPDYMVSTLAHEFQHMIHFYQKFILRDAQTSDVWEDEMASMMIEDLLSDKLQTLGPRGIIGTDYSEGGNNNPNGRIPIYNYNPKLTMAEPLNFDLYNYSSSYVYGAYLLRNFGGAAFLQAEVQNSYGDHNAITTALQSLGYNESFETTVRKCGTAVMLSNLVDLPQGYRFNSSSAFSSTINGTTYALGAINVFNYDQYFYTVLGPRINNAALSLSKDAASNFYYSFGTLNGAISFKLSLPESTQATIVAK